MNNAESNICQAIEIITNKIVQQAQFDKTIQATIVSCVDSTSGRYKLRYQDSLFYAYSNQPDAIYTQGTMVYVLIQNGDFSKPKTILGTGQNANLNNKVNIFKESRYEMIGQNCVRNSGFKAQLCSYDTLEGPQKKILYSVEEDINELNISALELSRYIVEADCLGCGGTFTTTLPEKQQIKGNYGLCFTASYKAEGGDPVKFSYIIDVNNMEGTPYSQNKNEQIGYFSISPEKFIRLEEVFLFAKDFPDSPKPEDYEDDIVVENLQLFASRIVTDQELDSYYLRLETPYGKVFTKEEGQLTEKRITAKYISKGVDITKSSNLLYYWFYKDATIDLTSPTYSKYGGRGWSCLNEFKHAGTDETSTVLEAIGSEKNYLIIKKNEILSQSKTYKCVAVESESLIMSKEITFENMGSQYKIDLTSQEGYVFYRDVGQTVLKAQVSTYSSEKQDYIPIPAEIELKYSWSKEDIEKQFEYLTPEEETPNQYAVSAKDIYRYSDYSCTVYNKNQFIGTQMVGLYNREEAEDKPSYELVITDGNQVFQYDEDGLAPTDDSLDTPQIIKPLSFYIFDNDSGQRIEAKSISAKDIMWIAPLEENTLIKILDIPDAQSSVLDRKTYTGNAELNYKLASSYNIKRNQNTITLQVQYNGAKLSANTNLLFLKVGENGSNGTKYVCRIVPNTSMENVYWPTIVVDKTTGVAQWNFEPDELHSPFKAELWENGVRIFDGTKSQDTVSLNWSMMCNKITADKRDDSNFEINNLTGEIRYKEANPALPLTNIVKATIQYDKRAFYCSLPVIKIEVENPDAGYSYSIADDSGFKSVIYKSDGTNPSYARDNPFEILVQSGGARVEGLTYEWQTYGKQYSFGSLVNSYLLTEDTYSLDLLADYKKKFRAASVYDGMCLSNAVICTVKEDTTVLAKITIPIHFYLQRYGNSSLNMWDGNSISIENDNGVILAPQVGAGKKNSDNSFTGVVIGVAKTENKEQVGLMGYSEGKQSIFLNADDGSATFGIEGKGQIVFEPSNNKAIIKSGNYGSGAGMLIDLSTPEIRFGQGAFIVDQNGKLFAQGARISGNFNASGSNYTVAFDESQTYIRASSSEGNSHIDFRTGNLYFKTANGSMSLNSTGLRIGASGDSEEGYLSYSTGQGLFINGSIVATSGSIGGWSIGKEKREETDTEMLHYLRGGKLTLWSDGKIDNGDTEEEDAETTSLSFKTNTKTTVEGVTTRYVEKVTLKGMNITFSHKLKGAKDDTYVETARIATNNLFNQSLYFRANAKRSILFGGEDNSGSHNVWAGFVPSYPKECLYNTDKDATHALAFGSPLPSKLEASTDTVITRNKIYVKDIQLTHDDFQEKTLVEYLKDGVGGGKMLPISQLAYDNLKEKDPNTFYLILDES